MAYFCNNKLRLLSLCLGLVTLGCRDSKVSDSGVVSGEPKTEYIMYQPSEMANFMNALYAYNQGIKTQIENGEIPAQMPLDLMTLHSAEMTKGKDRSQAWQNVVNVYIESQKLVTDSMAVNDVKLRYNEAINNCLACHKTQCTGPIPRIKKLLIQ